MQKHSKDPDDSRTEEKVKKDKQQEFKCGEVRCQKLYHSYTAFYNHCKKAHSGEFPEGSLLNNDPFSGPTKNRGRPRIKKNEVKNEFQIQSMKAENQLIEFMGTIKVGTGRAEELISYVEDPHSRMLDAKARVREWRGNNDDEEGEKYLAEIAKVNQIICDNDLPEFYDPIEFNNYQDRVDSYNFNSIYKFFKNRNIMPSRKQILLICWFARILSLKLLSQTIFVLLQKALNGKVTDEKELFLGKSEKFMQLVSTYLQLIQGEYSEESSRV